MASRIRQPLTYLLRSPLLHKPIRSIPARGITSFFTRKSSSLNKTNNLTRKNREAKVSQDVDARMKRLVPRNVVAEIKQLSNSKALQKIKEGKTFTVVSTGVKPNQLKILQIQTASLMYIPLQHMALRRGYDPEDFLAVEKLFKDKNFVKESLAKEILFKSNTKGLYGNYTEKWENIPQEIKTKLNKHKPTGIRTNIDHIVPRSDVATKFILTVVSSIEFDYLLVKDMTIKEFDEYAKIAVAKVMPELSDIEIINKAYNSDLNLRVITEEEHSKYTYLTKHKINPETFLPETIYERFDTLKAGIPTQIFGYNEKKETDYSSMYTKEEILNKMLETNTIITDDLLKNESPFVKKFAVNMKNFFLQRLGLPIQRGGSFQTIDEYSLYNYLVYTFASNNKNEGENSHFVKNDEKINREIRDDLEKIATSLFKHIIMQNRMYDSFVPKSVFAK